MSLTFNEHEIIKMLQGDWVDSIHGTLTLQFEGENVSYSFLGEVFKTRYSLLKNEGEGKWLFSAKGFPLGDTYPTFIQHISSEHLTLQVGLSTGNAVFYPFIRK